MASPISKFLFALLVSTGLSACVSIHSMRPNPAAPGDTVTVRMENVIGPAGNEPGVTLKFDGNVMALDPDTASLVGFEVPEGTPDGTYTVEIKDGLGFYEAITVVPLLRRRSASMSLVVESQ